MQFKRLHINNLGPFRGDTVFNLEVERGKPVVLFGGKNGAGKTNVLEAVKLCLYGKSAFTRKLNEPEYQKELDKRVHSHSSVTDAFVELSFNLARHGVAREFAVKRTWRRSSEKYSEELSVQENGSLLHDILPDHWQEFINEILPPSLSQLFFFDGERIQELASEDQSQSADALSDAVKSLFGLSLIDRLAADLSLIEKDTGARGESERARQISGLHKDLEEQRALLLDAESRSQAIGDRIGRERNQQVRVEDELRRRGGSYAKKREALIAREREASVRLKALEDEFRHECGELLPFVLCSDVVTALADDLEVHAKQEVEAIGSRALKEKADQIESAFSSTALSKVDKSLSISQKSKLKSYLDGLLAQMLTVKAVKGRASREIDLSRRDVGRVQVWTNTIRSEAVKNSRRFLSEMEALTRELMSARQELEKVPSDEDLKPLFLELKAISERLGSLLNEESALHEQTNSLRLKVRDVEFKLEKLAKEALSASDLSAVFERSIAARQVVKTFGVSLTKNRLQALSVEVLNTYNQLARKQDMISHVVIDPETYQLQLFSRTAGHMPKDRLSAGERQILAISILWALAKLSGRALPMIIDTPLGRLDSDHRAKLVERYFTAASHQVVVLSTDEEVDEHFYRTLDPYISRTYHLNYDTKVGATEVSQGYFWGGA